MMRAGILSMQRIANYGSFLQAYGLKSILSELGCEVEFVDYHPGRVIEKSDEHTGIMRKIYKIMDVMKSKASFRDKIKFILFKKNFASKYFHYLGISENYNYSPVLDVLIIGSDEVFNCVQNNSNVGFSPELFGENNRAERIISYAASFGNTTFDKLEKYSLDEKVRGWLKKMDAISVRDDNSRYIVKELVNRDPCIHLDPVLIYDYIIKCKEIPNHVPYDNYMILYGYSGRFTEEECKAIHEYATNKKLKVLTIGGIQIYSDKFIVCNPFEVIAYFRNAACIVTDTFHGTILSVITHKPFVSLVRNKGYGNSEKMIDLLGRLKLSDRLILEKDNIDIKRRLEEKINYNMVEDIIIREKERTYAYLYENLFG